MGADIDLHVQFTIVTNFIRSQLPLRENSWSPMAAPTCSRDFEERS
jgi:hypothetical protein